MTKCGDHQESKHLGTEAFCIMMIMTTVMKEAAGASAQPGFYSWLRTLAWTGVDRLVPPGPVSSREDGSSTGDPAGPSGERGRRPQHPQCPQPQGTLALGSPDARPGALVPRQRRSANSMWWNEGRVLGGFCDGQDSAHGCVHHGGRCFPGSHAGPSTTLGAPPP